MAFENLQLDWSDNINVICGENSTGKTTLLKAMIMNYQFMIVLLTVLKQKTL